MSESVTLPQLSPTEDASGAAPIASPFVPTASDAAETPALYAAPETHALLELIGRGLSSEADDATRTAARDLWARFAQTIATAAPVAPAAPMPPILPVPPMPPMSPMPPMPPMPPMSPIAMAARALRQLPPDQLLDLAVQRLRGALPAGATVATPKGIQFQLVPVVPTGGR